MADAAEDLARAPRAYIVAAAGCGKTEVAVRAAGIHSEGRQLLLTHTHAGVKALRDRLKQVGVPSKRVHVDTIAGFALRYASSFPKLSGLSITEPTTTAEWAAVYKAARRLMDIRIGRSILDNSYSGVFVDEYQDCIMPQHDLVMTLADTLPCRVLLDPLQGIFGFAGPLVSHETHLDPTFERLSDLTTPWRWRERNPNLGEWLVEIRAGLESGRTINLNNAPVARRTATYRDQISAYLRLTRNAGSVVAIGQWPRDCHSIASRLRGDSPAWSRWSVRTCFIGLVGSRKRRDLRAPQRSSSLLHHA